MRSDPKQFAHTAQAFPSLPSLEGGLESTTQETKDLSSDIHGEKYDSLCRLKCPIITSTSIVYSIPDLAKKCLRGTEHFAKPRLRATTVSIYSSHWPSVPSLTMASPSDGDIRSQTPMAQDLSSSTGEKPGENIHQSRSIEEGEVYDFKPQDVVLDTVNAAESQYTPADYKRVLRKVDMILLPLMWVCYGTQQADKTSISTQATFGMREDTGLVGQQFSWLTTIFYIMYLIGEAPGNYIMQRTSLRYTLAACMFVWGIIVLSIGFTHNFTQLMVLRALQGFAECTISPAFLLITATFYVSREHTMRSIVWGTSNAGMGIITQLIMYGIGKGAAHNPNGMQPWRYISIFLGCLTILLSVFSYFILGTPNEVKWLNAEEKRIVAARVVSNQTGSERQKHSEWKWDQVISAFKDPQTYFFFFTVIVNSLPNGGTTSFGNLVYVSFGFTPLETLVKGRIPQDVVSICWFLFVGIMTLKKPNLRCKLCLSLSLSGT